jgi:hypothetical protein
MYSTRIRVTTLLPACIYLNQLLSNTNFRAITVKITSDLPISYIAICLLKTTCYFSLGPIPKLNRTFCCTYNLSSPKLC